jgi:hypothetical protein
VTDKTAEEAVVGYDVNQSKQTVWEFNRRYDYIEPALLKSSIDDRFQQFC